MAKNCVVCNGNASVFKLRIRTSKGWYLCHKCIESSHLKYFSAEIHNYDKEEICAFILNRIEKFKDFKPTFIENAGTYSKRALVQIDFDNELISVDSYGFKFNQLKDFELIEDSVSYGKSGLGSAIAGGILLGGVGAVAGSILGSREKNIVKSIILRIEFINNDLEEINVELLTNYELNTRKKTDAGIYRHIGKRNEVISKEFIKIIQQNSIAQVSKEVDESMLTVADELLKYKSLIDEGYLSREEFEQMKEKLIKR